MYFLSGILFSIIFKYYSINTIYISLLASLLLLTFTHYLRSSINKNHWKEFSFTKLSALLLSINLIVAFLSQVLIAIFMVYVLKMFVIEEFSFGSLLGFVINTYIVLNGWVLIYFVIYYFNTFRKGEIEKWKLEAALKDAELLSLKSQINPHFIFNCLNNLRALILEDQNKARDMVTSLSEIMRYTFQFSQSEFVTFEKELEIIKDYIRLEKIQFEDRLEFNLEVESDTLSCEIPPMSVQLLIENAIKHGITESKNGGEINLSSKCHNKMLEIRVVNTGKYEPDVKQSGIGMENIKNRLDWIYKGSASLEIGNDAKGMVESALYIPIIESSRGDVNQNKK